jgi:uncharacterized protein (DUF1684 family)
MQPELRNLLRPDGAHVHLLAHACARALDPWWRISARFQPAPMPSSALPLETTSSWVATAPDRIVLRQEQDAGSEQQPLGRPRRQSAISGSNSRMFGPFPAPARRSGSTGMGMP